MSDMKSDTTNVEKEENRTREHGQSRIWWGLVLIFLGILFLLQRMGITTFRNWWALFILIPAFSSFAAAIEFFRRQGYVSYAVVNSLVGGLFPLAVAIFFFLDLNWAIYWPVFIILGGLSIFSNGLKLTSPDLDAKRQFEAIYQPWAILTGLGAITLGTGFLLKNLAIYDPATLMTNWWGLTIFFPAAGGLISAIVAVQKRGHLDWIFWSNLIVAVCVAIVALVAVLGLSWNILGPVIIIVIGLGLLLGFQRPSDRT